MKSKLKQNFKTDSQAGFSLVESLVFAAVLSIAAVTGVQYFSGVSKSNAHLRIQGELEDARTYIRNSVSCNATIAGQQTECATGADIMVRRSDSSAIINKLPTVSSIGANIELKASCTDAGGFYKINVDYRRSLNGNLLKNPLNGSTSDWGPLFKNVPFSCPPPAPDPIGPCLKVVENLCPANYASMSFADSSGTSTGPDQVPVMQQCCPAPSDLLLPDHTYAAGDCGADRVVTGVRVDSPYVSSWNPGSRYLRCTKIDTTKYKLGPRQLTDFFETPPYNSNSGFQGATRKPVEQLPLVQQFNLMKYNNLITDPYFPGTLQLTDKTSTSYPSQCIIPNGNGIIVARTNKYCGTHYGVEILDLSDNPVQLFPTSCTGSVTNTGASFTLNNVKCSVIPPFWQQAIDITSGR